MHRYGCRVEVLAGTERPTTRPTRGESSCLTDSTVGPRADQASQLFFFPRIVFVVPEISILERHSLPLHWLLQRLHIDISLPPALPSAARSPRFRGGLLACPQDDTIDNIGYGLPQSPPTVALVVYTGACSRTSQRPPPDCSTSSSSLAASHHPSPTRTRVGPAAQICQAQLSSPRPWCPRIASK